MLNINSTLLVRVSRITRFPLVKVIMPWDGIQIDPGTGGDTTYILCDNRWYIFINNYTCIIKIFFVEKMRKASRENLSGYNLQLFLI